MKHTLPNELQPLARGSPQPSRRPAPRRHPRPDDGLADEPMRVVRSHGGPSATPMREQLGRALVAVVFAGVSLLMRAAVRVYFRRVRVRHAERFPSRGPVLLIANHPAMWTDVLVLDVALGRKLQFLTHGSLFHRRLRALLLRVHGALPVLAATDDASARERNADTFQRCHELFARGAVVALFPEGVSLTDRTVLQLKTGAARLALEQAAEGASHRAPKLIPAGIHYANRTAFGSEVTVSVGEPIELAPFVALAREDLDQAVHALTQHMHVRLRELILDLPEPTLAAAVSELEPLAALSDRTATCELSSAQRIAARMELMRDSAPDRFASLQRRTGRYRRARRALRLSDRALFWDPWTRPWRQRLGRLGLACALGALPGAAGALLHAVPWAAGEWIAHRVGRDPVRFSFARIASGIVLFPVFDVLLLAILLETGMLRMTQLPAALLIVVSLGLFALSWGVWLRALLEHVRLLWLEAGHGSLVRRARREQRALLALVAAFRDEQAGPGSVRP